MDTPRLPTPLQALAAIADHIRARGLVAESERISELTSELEGIVSLETKLHRLVERWEIEAARSDALVRESSGAVRDSAKSRAAGVRLCIEDLRRTIAGGLQRRP
ncbi:MAG: hypothetical protein AVDCRST_MAG68-4280 [uncultured Gemmatimonadetes bacterium]|uniref:Uncharacterized protein n=1 Tax=uncultured Gemmatimonadota bacterium TaxID=203437 RepID=A0A6J4MMI3_9BACT|nr:MAG: hypothetical protein AVDCRST_MAG68-4280 [uncultured Gemmatimonadota bacterium]